MGQKRHIFVSLLGCTRRIGGSERVTGQIIGGVGFSRRIGNGKMVC